MKKRILPLLLSLALLFSLLPHTALFVSAETFSGTCGENLQWSFDSETGTLTITGSGQIENYPFGGTAPWYAYRESIKTVILSDGVTSIGDYAFYFCTSLTSITIPDGVTSIGDYAFYFCTSLTSITIPDSVTSIGIAAFEYCFSLSMSIPDSVTSIGDYAFFNCNSLTSVTIPGGVTSIGYYVFGYCHSLTNVTIPNSVKSIGMFAFCGCDSLTSILIPDSVTSIDYYAFADCESLSSVTIPDSVTNIGNDAFEGCISLTSVTIPDGVTNIGSGAFAACTSLQEIQVGSNQAYYSSIDGVLLNKAQTELLCYPAGRTGAYVIPDGVMSIGNDALNGCAFLTSVTIPDSVTSIGDRAFYECTSLTGVTIPNTVTSIGFRAFDGCTALTSITIPDSVASIDSYAFSDCNSLMSVTVLTKTADIGNYAFGWVRDGYDIVPIEGFTIYAYSGSTAETYATGNGFIFVALDADPCALGHDWGDWIVTTAPTCTEKGVETRTCTRCGMKETRDVAALGHNFVDGVCTVCGAKDPDYQPPLPAVNFTDVPTGAYYADPVAWAVAHGVTNGTSDTTFSPNQTCTRAQVVTFLWRAKGCPEPKSSKSPFVDVQDANQYYYKAVLWAVENGITKGVDDTHFGPNVGCTRGQVVTFLWRTEKEPAPKSNNNPFTDVPTGAYYYTPVLWAVGNGITNGTSDTTFSPNATCTRGQIVTFLYRDLG